MDFQPAEILEVARRAGLSPRRVAMDEYVVPCPSASQHRHGDANPSCRLNPSKNTFYCDPCGEGSGLIEFSHRLGLHDGPRAHDASPRPTPATKASGIRPLHFDSRGPISATTQEWMARYLNKRYTPEAWAKAGVL